MDEVKANMKTDNIKKNKKLILLGLDGSTFDLLKPWCEQGHLPNFKKLLEKGAHGELKSTIPPRTIPAWLSMYTGMNPGRLGVYDFFEEQDYKYIRSDYKKKERQFFWNLLGDKDKVCIFNCPGTYPPTPVNGYMVTGMFTPSVKHKFTYPESLKEELNLDENYSFFEEWNDFNVVKEKLNTGFTQKLEVIKKLLEKDCDCNFFVIGETDWITHFFWHYFDKNHHLYKPNNEHESVILDFFKRVDSELLSFMIDYVDKTESNLIIVSDHGMGPWKGLFHTNSWLIKNGLMKMKDKTFLMKAFSKMGLDKEKVILLLTKLKLVGFFQKIIPRKVVQSVPKLNKSVDWLGSVNNNLIDWSNTKAFTFSQTGCLFINKKGRNKHGCVTEEEYEKVREQIISLLKSHKEVKIEAWKTEEIYRGKLYEKVPDVLFLIEGDAYMCCPDIAELDVCPLPDHYTQKSSHRLNGILIAYGNDIEPGKSIQGAEIYDIAPTTIHFFDGKIHDEIDGKVLFDIFKADSSFRKQKIKTFSAEEKKTQDEEEIINDSISSIDI